MRMFVAAIFAPLALLAPAAWAQQAPAVKFVDAAYVSGSLGLHDPYDETTGGYNAELSRDVGFEGHAAIGRQYKNYRAEVELGWYHDGAGHNGDGDSDTVSLMANAFYDVPTGTRLRPYVGGGVGMAVVNFSDVTVPAIGTFNDNEVGVAWQGMVGLEYDLAEGMTLTGGYRWFDVSNLKMQTGASRVSLDGFGSHNLELGLRYRF